MQPYVVTIASEKGGVGKTTLATNLAIYLKALDENLPVTLLSFDNHFSVDRMFRIGKRVPSGDVYQLLQGANPEQLLELGEFGVQFIPSSHRLTELRETLSDPATLAEVLAESSLDGMLLIDTRPDLDVFTGNALFAADRVLVPVKDTPSLENSGHLYAFFDQHRLSRQALRILPCLVDARIRYQGPFETPHQLLRAYALNRGYRCMEGFIAKSPKVESLNTNPEGRIYPVLTHGRGTEVHPQLLQLAEQLYQDFRQSGPRRLLDVQATRRGRTCRQQQAYLQRAAAMPSGCLLCGAEFAAGENDGFFLENGSATRGGFIHARCWCDAVFQQVYASRKGPDPALVELFLESSRRSCFGLAPADSGSTEGPVFYRLDEQGHPLSSRRISAPGGWFGGTPAGLHKLWHDLAGETAEAGSPLLLCRRVAEAGPAACLEETSYQEFQRIKRQFAANLTQQPAATQPA